MESDRRNKYEAKSKKEKNIKTDHQQTVIVRHMDIIEGGRNGFINTAKLVSLAKRIL